MKYIFWIVFASIIVLILAGIIVYLKPKLFPEVATAIIISPIPPVP